MHVRSPCRFLEQELGLSFVSELSSNLTLIVTVPCSIVSDSTPWTVARQAPLSLGFSRQEYWSAVPFLPPGHLPDPGIEPASLAFPALVEVFFTTSTTWETDNRIVL